MAETSIGRIHSVESFGTVDGPGIRLVVFMQGCNMRCQYCHNPDTWSIKGGKLITVAELLALYERNKAFYKNGGITLTGGEPLLQIDFVTALFSEARRRGIHTCLDTSGAVFRANDAALIDRFDALCAVTDIVMLDIKHSDPEAHLKLTGVKLDNIMAFAAYLTKKNVPVWVRHVVVPGITDAPEEWHTLGIMLAHMPNLRALDVLPYHTMGVQKYKALGLPYSLEGVPPLDAAVAARARAQIVEARHDELMRMKRAGHVK